MLEEKNKNGLPMFKVLDNLIEDKNTMKIVQSLIKLAYTEGYNECLKMVDITLRNMYSELSQRTIELQALLNNDGIGNA